MTWTTSNFKFIEWKWKPASLSHNPRSLCKTYPNHDGRQRKGERDWEKGERERKEVRERQRAGQPTCCMRSTIIKANFFSSAFYPKVLKRKKTVSGLCSLSLCLSPSLSLSHTHTHSLSHPPTITPTLTHPHSHTLTWVVAFMESDLPFLRAGLPRCCKHIQPSE